MDTVKRVYELAEANHITLYQLSQKSGVSYSTIKTTEKRGGQLKVDTIERICAALGIPLSTFFAESQDF
jgi:transcriptional regulator with XRE-family HTH domain